MEWIWIWLALLITSIIFEFITMELVSVWFAVGAFVSLILSICGASVEVQWIVFASVSIVCIIGLRKVSLGILLKNDKAEITKKDMVIGKEFKLLTDITKERKGTIKINDVEWSVVSKNGEAVKAGSRVKVLELKGNKYIVEKTFEQKTRAKKEDKE